MAFLAPTFPKRFSTVHSFLSPVSTVSSRSRADLRKCVRARINSQSDERRPKRRTRRREYGPSVFARAQQLASRGQVGQARASLRSHVTEYPSDSRAWLALGRLEKDAKAAFRVFSEAVQHCPNCVHLHHAWAVRAGRAREFEESRRLFKECVKIAPKDGVSWQAYAIMEERSGDVKTARLLFEEGARRAPNCVHLWSAWGALERRQGRHKVAVKYLAQAVELEPEHCKSLQMWALSCEKLGNADEAMHLFSRALAANPRSVPTLQACALFHARRGRLERARELLSTASRVDSSHAPVWHAWATMERRARNYDRARELFDRGVRADPYSSPMLRAWAEMELELGHIDSSESWRVAGRKSRRRHLTRVGENLHMLRLIIERRSDDDVSAVMRWLNDRSDFDRAIYERLAERSEADARKLQHMVARRSAADVRAFAEWVEERYETDRRIGTHILNWDISAMIQPQPYTPKLDHAIAPREWYKLKDKPDESLRATDERLYYNEEPVDYSEAVQLLGRITESITERTPMVVMLLALSLLLLAASTSLEELGYAPAGSQTVDNGDVGDVAPPSGVDAYLYDQGADSDSISTAGGTIRKVRTGAIVEKEEFVK